MICWAILQRNHAGCGLCGQALPCRAEGDGLHIIHKKQIQFLRVPLLQQFQTF
jgi:hypothetical protein